MCTIALLAAPAAAGTRLKSRGARGGPQSGVCVPTCPTDHQRRLLARFKVAPTSPTGATCQPFFANDTHLPEGTTVITLTPDPNIPGHYVMAGDRPALLPPASTTRNDCGFNDIRQFITFDGVPNTQYDVQNILISNTGTLTFDLTYGANGVLFNGQSACLSATGYPATGFEEYPEEYVRFFQNYAADNPFTDPRLNAYARGFRAAAGENQNLLIGNQVFTSEAPGEFYPGQTLQIPAGQVPISVDIGRYSGDAIDDIAVATSTPDGSASSVTVGIQGPNGIFTVFTNNVDNGLRQILTGPPDANGRDKLLVLTGQATEAWSFSADGIRQSTEVLPVEADVLIWSNGDGSDVATDDLAFVGSDDSGQPSLGFYNYQDNGLYFRSLPVSGPLTSPRATAADFTSDGITDIIVVNGGSEEGEPFAILARNNAPSPGQFAVSLLPLDLGSAVPVAGPPVVRPVQFSCDPHQGIAINGVQFQGDGAGNFRVAVAPAIDAGSTLISEIGGDVDNDGSPDLVRLIRSAIGDVTVQLYEQQDVPQPERPVITSAKINKKNGKVVVKGTGLVAGTRIAFNGAKLDATLKAGGKLVSTTTPPPLARGTEVNVQVILPDGTVSNGFLYRKP